MKVLACTVQNEILTADLDVSEVFNYTERNGYQCTTQLVCPVIPVFSVKLNKRYFQIDNLPRGFRSMFGFRADSFRQSLNSFLKDHYSNE